VLAKARLTADEARQAALVQYPGATVTSVELENEDEAPVYGVLLQSGAQRLDVKVHAVSGKVLRADDGTEDGAAEGAETAGE